MYLLPEYMLMHQREYAQVYLADMGMRWAHTASVICMFSDLASYYIAIILHFDGSRNTNVYWLALP